MAPSSRFWFVWAWMMIGASISRGQATLPAFYSGPWANTALPTGWTLNGLSTDYASNYDGIDGGVAKFDGSGDFIQIDFSDEPSTVSYFARGNSLSGGYVFKVQESANGSIWTDVATYDSGNPLNNSAVVQYTNNLQPETRYVKFIYATKVVGNVGLDGVLITEHSAPMVSFNPSGNQTIPVSNLLAMTVSITPSDSGMESWSLMPASLGQASLSDDTFTFIPAAGDDITQNFTLSVVATNSIGTTTGITAISVTAYEPPTPVIIFSPSPPYNIMATYTQEVGVAVMPAGSGIERWALSPSNHAGAATLEATNFTFTTDMADGPATYALTVVATNEYVAVTGMAEIVVMEYIPSGSYICTFEDGTKTSYASADVTLSNKVWNLTGILIGTDANDLKIGSKSARLQYGWNGLTAAMTLLSPDLTNGIWTVSFWYGPYGTHGNQAPVLAIEINSNLTENGWIEVGSVDAGAVSELTYYSTDFYVRKPTYVRIRGKSGIVSRSANYDNIVFSFVRTVFTVSVDRANGFIVPEGTSAEIVAEAGVGTEPYSYSWASTLGESHYLASNTTFTILPSAPAGSYSATIVATDSALLGATNTVVFNIVSNYAIHITPPTNGSVATDPTGRAIAGTAVTITATPDSGYAIDDITVVNSALNSVTVTSNVFTMPDSAVMVSASFRGLRTNDITIVGTANGTVETHPDESAVEGEQVTIVASPDYGYAVDQIAVFDSNLNPVVVTDNSFVMPSSAVSIMVTFSTYMRSEDFNAWPYSYALLGDYSRRGWFIQNASIAPTSGVLGTQATLLSPTNGAVVSPPFLDGVGEVRFWAKSNKSGEMAYLILQTSTSGGSDWVNRAAFTVTTAKIHAAWLCLTNTAATVVRLTFNEAMDSGAVLVDNVEIRVPALYRNQNFDSWPTRISYVTENYQGWYITNCIVDTQNAYQGKMVRLNTTLNNYVLSPELPGGIGSISFRTRKWAASDAPFTLQVQVSPDGADWTTVTNVSATSTNYEPVALYLNDETNRYVRFYHSAGAVRVLIDDIRIPAPTPRPDVLITPGLDPVNPIVDEPMALLADIVPRYGATVLSVTGYYRIAYSAWSNIPMVPIDNGFCATVDNIPGLPADTMVRYRVEVQYAGIGAEPGSTSYSTSICVSGIYTNYVGTQASGRLSVQGSFIATNSPPPNMMRIGRTLIWESDHHVTNTAAITLRFVSDLDGPTWGVTNGTMEYLLPAIGTMAVGATNHAIVAVDGPGRYRITFNQLTGAFTFTRVYTDDSQGKPPNLLNNPGFELTTAPDGGEAEGWVSWQSWPKPVADGFAPHSGAWCGTLYGQQSPEWTDYSSFEQKVPVGEGRTYQASAWFKASWDWTASSTQIRLEWRNADGSSVGDVSTVEIPPLSADWVKYTAEGVAPAMAVTARVVFVCSGAGSAGTMHLDDAEMRALAPTGYYASAYGLTKENLRTALREIISVALVNSYEALHTYYITSDARPDGRVWDMYSDNPGGVLPYSYPFETCEQAGNYRIEGDCYNREHSWPQSWFNSLSPMSSDIFHIYPTDGKVNGDRGNYPYGEVAYPTNVSMNGSKTGPCATPGYAGPAFEPLDIYKGDFARTYFYMSTRYYGQDYNWRTNGAVKGAEFNPWFLDMLLRWHEDDPVSIKEIVRNEVAYAVQSNRNPFIDYPEWAHDIWGHATNRELPRIVILDPGSLLSSVSAGAGILSVQGQVSGQVVGEITWSNATTKSFGSLALSGTNFLIADIPLAYGRNLINIAASNVLGQMAGRTLVAFRQSGAQERFDDEDSWYGGLCRQNWYEEFTELSFIPANALECIGEFGGSQVAIKKSVTMNASGCSWGMSPRVDAAMVRYQTPFIVTNFSVYLAPYTTNAAINFEVRISTNSGSDYVVLLATNVLWFDAARQFKKYESPPIWAKPQPGMLTYVEIVKTSGEMIFLDDFDCYPKYNPDDIDLDFMLDEWEIRYFGNLTDSDGTGDADEDGLPDNEEFGFGTNPLLMDTDGDGYSDLAEMIAGTCGTNELDYFAINGVGQATEMLDPFVLYWDSVTGRTYRLFIGRSILGGWSNVLQVTGDGQQKNYTNESPDRTGFYRLTVEKP